MTTRLNNQKGFTLVEIIAVLILLGILAAVAVPRYVNLTGNAEIRALDAAIAELNGRENMNWANIKLSSAGWADDATTFAALRPEISGTTLGTDYTWVGATDPVIGGGQLQFKNTTRTLVRTASTLVSPGIWK